MGKYRFGFVLQLQHKEVTAPLESTDTEASEEGATAQPTASAGKQPQQQILTPVYLCRTDSHCKGILSLWVQCKDGADVNSVCTAIIPETLCFLSPCLPVSCPSLLLLMSH